MIKVKIVPCEPSEPKVYGGKDLRDLLHANSQFRTVWIPGLGRLEMPKEDEPPVSGMRIKLPKKETP